MKMTILVGTMLVLLLASVPAWALGPININFISSPIIVPATVMGLQPGYVVSNPIASGSTLPIIAAAALSLAGAPVNLNFVNAPLVAAPMAIMPVSTAVVSPMAEVVSPLGPVIMPAGATLVATTPMGTGLLMGMNSGLMAVVTPLGAFWMPTGGFNSLGQEPMAVVGLGGGSFVSVPLVAAVGTFPSASLVAVNAFSPEVVMAPGVTFISMNAFDPVLLPAVQTLAFTPTGTFVNQGLVPVWNDEAWSAQDLDQDNDGMPGRHFGWINGRHLGWFKDRGFAFENEDRDFRWENNQPFATRFSPPMAMPFSKPVVGNGAASGFVANPGVRTGAAFTGDHWTDREKVRSGFTPTTTSYGRPFNQGAIYGRSQRSHFSTTSANAGASFRVGGQLAPTNRGRAFNNWTINGRGQGSVRTAPVNNGRSFNNWNVYGQGHGSQYSAPRSYGYSGGGHGRMQRSQSSAPRGNGYSGGGGQIQPARTYYGGSSTGGYNRGNGHGRHG